MYHPRPNRCAAAIGSALRTWTGCLSCALATSTTVCSSVRLGVSSRFIMSLLSGVPSGEYAVTCTSCDAQMLV